MNTRAYMPVAESTEWETPPELFDRLWEEFEGFDLDPCCQFTDYTAERVVASGGLAYNPVVDGLANSWHGKVFMNPPYGPTVKLWVAKAFDEVACGNAELVVALLKATTDVKWWHEYVEGIVTPRFIKGRLHFGGQEGPAPFPSVIIVWRKLAPRAAPAGQGKMAEQEA